MYDSLRIHQPVPLREVATCTYNQTGIEQVGGNGSSGNINTVSSAVSIVLPTLLFSPCLNAADTGHLIRRHGGWWRWDPQLSDIYGISMSKMGIILLNDIRRLKTSD